MWYLDTYLKVAQQLLCAEYYKLTTMVSRHPPKIITDKFLSHGSFLNVVGG